MKSYLNCKQPFLDTCVLIYFLEGHELFGRQVKKIMEKVESGIIKATISALTVTELLTGPYRCKNDLLALEYHALFYYFPNLEIVDINLDVAVDAARIRGTYDIATPDSLLLATALRVKADAFITSDKKLLRFKELEVFLIK